MSSDISASDSVDNRVPSLRFPSSHGSHAYKLRGLFDGVPVLRDPSLPTPRIFTGQSAVAAVAAAAAAAAACGVAPRLATCHVFHVSPKHTLVFSSIHRCDEPIAAILPPFYFYFTYSSLFSFFPLIFRVYFIRRV